MVTVVSPHLASVNAAWDDGPDAGGWIAARLGPFGASVGHAVPRDYPAHAVVPIPLDEGPAGPGALAVMDALLDVLGPLTGQQPVHAGMWEGWAWWYDTGSDLRTVAARGVDHLLSRSGLAGGPAAVIADPRLSARRVTADDILDIDD